MRHPVGSRLAAPPAAAERGRGRRRARRPGRDRAGRHPLRGPLARRTWAPAESTDHFDTTAEVDATFRTQRRAAVGYFVVFLAVTFAVPALTLVLGWWSTGRIGGMSPNFVMAAGGLYVVFFLVALAGSSLAEAVEDRMLGGGDEHLGALPPDGGDGVPDPLGARRDDGADVA